MSPNLTLYLLNHSYVLYVNVLISLTNFTLISIRFKHRLGTGIAIYCEISTIIR